MKQQRDDQRSDRFEKRLAQLPFPARFLIRLALAGRYILPAAVWIVKFLDWWYQSGLAAREAARRHQQQHQESDVNDSQATDNNHADCIAPPKPFIAVFLLSCLGCADLLQYAHSKETEVEVNN